MDNHITWLGYELDAVTQHVKIRGQLNYLPFTHEEIFREARIYLDVSVQLLLNKFNWDLEFMEDNQMEFTVSGVTTGDYFEVYRKCVELANEYRNNYFMSYGTWLPVTPGDVLEYEYNEERDEYFNKAVCRFRRHDGGMLKA